MNAAHSPEVPSFRGVNGPHPGSPLIRANLVLRRGEEAATLTIIVATPKRWRRMPARRDEGWRVVRRCGLVLAVKME